MKLMILAVGLVLVGCGDQALVKTNAYLADECIREDYTINGVDIYACNDGNTYTKADLYKRYKGRDGSLS